jgi:hypothetical protein
MVGRMPSSEWVSDLGVTLGVLTTDVPYRLVAEFRMAKFG